MVGLQPPLEPLVAAAGQGTSMAPGWALWQGQPGMPPAGFSLFPGCQQGFRGLLCPLPPALCPCPGSTATFSCHVPLSSISTQQLVAFPKPQL